jgi:two-component system, OmpR family, KDP operon response regulator KdpE
MNTRQPRVLVVDDEPDVLELDRVSLEERGFLVSAAADGEEALRRTRDDLPDLVLLDLRLPDLDGFDVLRQLRAASTVPVILLTVSDDEGDKVRGLELGADDYVTQPFRPGELAARIRAVLRRVAAAGPPGAGLVTVDERLAIDFDERDVVVDGRRIPLRPTEYRLLYQLMRNAGHTLPIETLLALVWGPEYRAETPYVHLYVAYLRRKLERDPAHPQYILTRRGVGYAFRRLPSRRPAAAMPPWEPPAPGRDSTADPGDG